MKPSAELVAFVQGWETCRLEAYLDGGGVPTIGYGHTRGVKMGDACSQETADEWLRDELGETAAGVDGMVAIIVLQSQFDALTSFAYNLGLTALRTSTLLRMLNRGEVDGAADQFLRWDHDNGVVIRGLSKRRRAERAMFLDADYSGRP